MSCNCFIKTSCSISPLVLPEDARQSLDVSQREGRSMFVPALNVSLPACQEAGGGCQWQWWAVGIATEAICGEEPNTVDTRAQIDDNHVTIGLNSPFLTVTFILKWEGQNVVWTLFSVFLSFLPHIVTIFLKGHGTVSVKAKGSFKSLKSIQRLLIHIQWLGGVEGGRVVKCLRSHTNTTHTCTQIWAKPN